MVTNCHKHLYFLKLLGIIPWISVQSYQSIGYQLEPAPWMLINLIVDDEMLYCILDHAALMEVMVLESSYFYCNGVIFF